MKLTEPKGKVGTTKHERHKKQSSYRNELLSGGERSFRLKSLAFRVSWFSWFELPD